ncbi:MAG TPA: hypothetical protein VKB58_08430 [Terriglobales bacterium]|jgi:hypothetical protein|nr:hypothetical protein [Terriglobales bacterium]
MAIVVVGGHSRSVGKTSVVAGLIAALPELHWTAMKITQYGHGICSTKGRLCHCACDGDSWAITEELDRAGNTDSSRFLVAGAERSLWVRTRQGMLGDAMPSVRKELEEAPNTIFESNSILHFLQPDLYLTVLDRATADFKASAQQFLKRADAVILHDGSAEAAWNNISLNSVGDVPMFHITPPEYVTPDLVDFVRGRI